MTAYKYFMKRAFIVGLSLLFISCSNNNSDSKDNTIKNEDTTFLNPPKIMHKAENSKDAIGGYVYMDKNDCLHITDDCYAFLVESAGYALHRIQISKINEKELFYCCKECVSDSAYDELKSRISGGLVYKPKKAY